MDLKRSAGRRLHRLDRFSILDESDRIVGALRQREDERAGNFRARARLRFRRVADDERLPVEVRALDLVSHHRLAAMDRRDDDLFSEHVGLKPARAISHHHRDAEHLVERRLIRRDDKRHRRIRLELVGNKIALVSFDRDGLAGRAGGIGCERAPGQRQCGEECGNEHCDSQMERGLHRGRILSEAASRHQGRLL